MKRLTLPLSLLLLGGAFGFFFGDALKSGQLATISPWIAVFVPLAFPLVILLHELGHYLAGRLVGLKFHALMLFKWGLVAKQGELARRSFPRMFGGGWHDLDDTAVQSRTGA